MVYAPWIRGIRLVHNQEIRPNVRKPQRLRHPSVNLPETEPRGPAAREAQGKSRLVSEGRRWVVPRLLTIDRYLLRQFIQTFLICYLSLTGLYIVFDAFTNLDEFLKAGEENGGLFRVLVPHYSYRALFFFDRTAGMLTLVAAMFTVTWIQRHNELVALMAAGVSKIRIVAPVIGAGVVIALLATLNREFIVPQLREELAKTPQDLLGTRAKQLQPRRDYETEILLQGECTVRKERRIENPQFWMPAALSDYGNKIIAKNAYYMAPEKERPGGYLLKEVDRPKDLAEKGSLTLGDRPILLTPKDYPEWLKEGECFVASNIDFEQLTGGTAWRDFSSTVQLIQGLRNPSMGFGADVRVAIHSRFVQPFLDINLLFLGMPLVLGRERRNVFIAIGLCGAIVSFFVLTALTFQFLGGTYLARFPEFAAWAPLLIFVPAAVWLAGSIWE